jgi:phosphopantetheinyl transferase
MRANVIKDCPQITVNTVSFPHQKASVVYACLPCTADHQADQIHLVSILYEHLVGMTDNMPLQIVHDPLGRPRLLLGECQGPAISFSEGSGKIWAALCPDVSEIGIDAAGTDEFSQEYPFSRVFQAQELQHALKLTDGDLKKAAALLWSVKEVVTRSRAFHLADPLQLCVNHDWKTAYSILSEKFWRDGHDSRTRHLARSFFRENMWLPARLNRDQRPPIIRIS